MHVRYRQQVTSISAGVYSKRTAKNYLGDELLDAYHSSTLGLFNLSKLFLTSPHQEHVIRGQCPNVSWTLINQRIKICIA